MASQSFSLGFKIKICNEIFHIAVECHFTAFLSVAFFWLLVRSKVLFLARFSVPACCWLGTRSVTPTNSNPTSSWTFRPTTPLRISSIDTCYKHKRQKILKAYTFCLNRWRLGDSSVKGYFKLERKTFSQMGRILPFQSMLALFALLPEKNKEHTIFFF